MKKLIFLIFLTFIFGSAYGQSTFYYCSGKKVALTRPMTRAVTSSTFYDKNGEKMEATGYVYIKLKSANDKNILSAVAKQYKLTVVEQDKFMPLWFVLKSDNAHNIVDTANAIYETGKFAECSPDFSMRCTEISYDPMVKDQWGLYNSEYKGIDINVSKAWNYSTGRGVVIAIVDKGIDLKHIDLADNIYPKSYDAMSDSTPSKIYGNHGTHCAGIAAAVRNNGIQVSGVAPDAKLMSISSELDETAKTAHCLARGINWAWKNGADIISCSWHCAEQPQIVEAIDSAMTRGRNGKGCIIVKSAGNGGYNSITFPGNCGGVMAIANLRKFGDRRDSGETASNYGQEMFLSAPGTEILSTIPGNLIDIFTGTSMAAPHVAGVAALMLERNPSLTVWQVREILARTAKKLDSMGLDINNTYGLWNEYFGYGLVDAYEAVLGAINFKQN